MQEESGQFPRQEPGAATDFDRPRDSDNTWPSGVRTGLFLVGGILVINSIVTLWATASFAVSGGVGTLYAGDCDRVRQLGSGLHVAINVIGTLLLGASNYCMQCLSAPTRAEIDAQHAVRRWMDLGIMSLRNLLVIARPRAWLWLLLGVSSFPLHLMCVRNLDPSLQSLLHVCQNPSVLISDSL